MPALTVDRCCEQAYGVPTAGGLSGLEGTNSEWGYDASTGQVKVSQAADLLGKTACKDDIENCCLTASQPPSRMASSSGQESTDSEIGVC